MNMIVDQIETIKQIKPVLPDYYSLEILKSYADYLGKIDIKTSQEKEGFFNNILTLLCDLVHCKFFDEASWSQGNLDERDTYFINTFSPKLLREIANSNNDTSDAYLKEKFHSIIRVYIQQFVLHFNNSKMFPIWESLVELFQDFKPIHKAKDKSDAPDIFLEHIYDTLNPQSQEWRDKLQKGDMVDFLLLEKDSYFNAEKLVSGLWTRAEIVDVDVNKQAKVKLLGNGDYHSISLNSCYILPLNTLSKDYELRDAWSIGDLVDVYDCRGWYPATIVDKIEKIRAGQTLKWVKYGTRVYREKAKLMDRRERYYVGWSENCDKDICVHDPKIKPLGELSKKIDNWDLLAGYPNDTRKFNELETFIPFDVEGKKFYAIPKKGDKEIDVSYYDMVNTFGELGGFDKIISVLSNDCNSISPEAINTLFNICVDLIYNLHMYLHFEFCKTFIDKFYKLAFNFLNSFILDNRNFKREKFESCIKKLKEILSKLYIETDVNIKFDYFSVEFGINCLKSPMLDKKLIGLKMITDILNDASRYSTSNITGVNSIPQTERHIGIDSLMTILKQAHFFDLIFSPNAHIQIFQKSGDLIRAMLSCKQFGEEELIKLYRIASESSDLNIKMAIYKSIKDNSYHIDKELSKYFIKLMMNREGQNFLTANQLVIELELLDYLQKYLPTYDTNPIFFDIGLYFYNLIFTYDNYQIVEKVVNEFIHLLRSSDYKEHRLVYIEKLLLRLKESNTTIVQSPSKEIVDDFVKTLRVLRQIVSGLGQHIEEWQRNKIHMLIVDDHKIISVVLDFLQNYYNFLIVRSEDVKLNKEFPNEFFSFVNFLINNSRVRLSHEQVHLLFLIFVEKPIQGMSHINQLFKFLREADEKRILPDDAIKNLFIGMANNQNLEFDSIGLDLVKVLWNIFLSVNKTNNKIRINERHSAARSSGNISDYVLSIDVQGIPFDLDGYNIIFRLVTSSPNGEVSRLCSENFIQLYVLNNKSPEERREIWSLLIQSVLNIIDKESITTFKINIIQNSLELLRKLIEESEKKGTAGVISHSSINKTAGITLKINNTHMYLVNLPPHLKNFSVKVFSNTTLWDLKKLLSRKLNVQPELILLKDKENKDVPDSAHGKTLDELKFKNDDTLSIQRNHVVDNIPKAPLTQFGKLTDRFKNVLTEIFYQFAGYKKIKDDGSSEICMNREDLAKCMRVGTNLSEFEISIEDPRIINIFNRYDTDKDDLITCEDFLKFYYEAVEVDKKTAYVWDNLKHFGLRNDLRRMEEPLDMFNSNREIMPRWIISKVPEFFNIVFILQERIERAKSMTNSNDLNNLSIAANQFLNMICTNPHIYKNLLLIESKDDWIKGIDSSNYFRQLYSLQIIESFFDEFSSTHADVDNEPAELSILEDKDRNLIQPNHKITWLQHFIVNGGLEFILGIFIQYNLNDNDYVKNKCANMTIKIIRNSINIILKSRSKTKTIPEKEEILRAIRKDSLTPENALQEETTNTVNVNISLSRTHSSDPNEDKVTQILNEKQGDAIIGEIFQSEKFNVKQLITKCIEILSINDDRLLTSNTLNLFSLLFISSENLSEISSYLFNDDKFERVMINGLLHDMDVIIRANFYKSLKNISKNLIQLGEYSFVTRLLNKIQHVIFDNGLSSNARSNCKYLFNLCARLVGMSTNNEDIKANLEFNFTNLAYNIYDTLLNSQNSIEDPMLVGYLKLLNILVLFDSSLKDSLGKEKNLIKLLINKFTFKSSQFPTNPSLKTIPFAIKSHEAENQGNKDINDEVRQSTFNLVISLIEDNNENLKSLFNTRIAEVPIQITSDEKAKKSNNYNPSSERRALCGYVGIKNLGNICYMNSVLQQFFNVPSFRYAILQVNDALGFTEHPDNTAYDDNVLHQLQKLYTYLDLSDRQYVYPTEFCWSFKDSMGARTDIKIQNDAQEFLTRFFSRIETSLEKTPYKYLMQSMFGGETCSQVICRDCGNVSSTFEDFYNLSLEVKNMKTIKESLDKFISEERIDGYNCGNCKKTTTVTKKNSLARLPNVLIVHLQRIAYNYDNYVNEKINTALEFPHVLNLKDHCVEENKATQNDRVYEREDAYYEYILVGVVVHMGHADGGHYFSYINTERNGNGNEWDNHKFNWLNFNDAWVSHFDITTLEENSFGGRRTDIMTVDSDYGPAPANPPAVSGFSHDQAIAAASANGNEFFSQHIETGQSAYMLVYERKLKTPIKIIRNDQPNDYQKINDDNRYAVMKEFDIFYKGNPFKEEKFPIFYDEIKKEFFDFVPFYNVSKLYPNVYLMDVVNDNIEFYNDDKIFNKDFNEFFEKILENVEKILLKNTNSTIKAEFGQIFEMILAYIFKVISKSYYKQNLSGIVERISSIINNIPMVSEFILNYLIHHKELLHEILFSSEESSNAGYKTIILNAIKLNLKQFNSQAVDYVTNFATPDGMQIELDKEYKPPASLILLLNLIEMLPVELTRYWTKMLSFLELLDELTQSRDPLIIELFIKKGMIARLADFFLQKDSPYYNKADNRVDMGRSGGTGKFSPLFSIIATLLSYCTTSTCGENELQETPHTFIERKEEQNHKTYKLSDKDEKLLTNVKFYSLAAKENYNNTALGRIMSHMMYNNYEFSKHGMFVVLENLNKGISLLDAKNAFDLITEVIQVNDSITPTRMEWLFGIPVPLYSMNGSVPSYYYSLLSNKAIDKLCVFRSHLIIYTNWDSLTDRILFRFFSSSDYLAIINMFITQVLLKSTNALTYFEQLPHPRPNNLHDYSARARLFLLEQAHDEINRYMNNKNKSHEIAISNYHAYLQVYLSIVEKASSLKNLHYGNINYRTGGACSDKVYLCDHLREGLSNYLIMKDIYIVVLDYDLECKYEGSGDSTNSKAYEMSSDYPELNFGMATAWTSMGEDIFYKKVIAHCQPGVKYRRRFKHYILENSTPRNVIRRYVLYNSSSIDYKTRFKFKSNDPNLNFHLPDTEIVIIAKKFNGQNVISFYIEDFSKDWGDYELDIDLIPLKPSSICLNAGNPGTNVPVFQLEENEKQEDLNEIKLEDEEKINIESEEVESVPIDCMRCFKSNIFNNDDMDYICKYCGHSVFG